MQTDPRPDDQPNRPQCWCCGSDLHRANVALYLDAERKSFVPVCTGCWETMTVRERIDFALRFDARRREWAGQRIALEQQQQLQALIEEWVAVGRKINNMEPPTVMDDLDDPDWWKRATPN